MWGLQVQAVCGEREEGHEILSFDVVLQYVLLFLFFRCTTSSEIRRPKSCLLED
jgi:hypothetical protein